MISKIKSPVGQFISRPQDILFGVANQARVRAFVLSKPLSKVGRRYVVNLMRARFEHHAVNDSRHVTGNASAALRQRRVVRMAFSALAILRMALKAHLVGVLFELERCEILFRAGRVRIVAARALGIAFSVAGRASERFDDEGGFPEAAVLVERAAAEFAVRSAYRR